MATRKHCSICFSSNHSEISPHELARSVIKGELHFFFSVDMREFLSNPLISDVEKKNQAFEKIQGSKGFANAIRKMKIKDLDKDFSKVQEIDSLRIKGFNNGVFGAVLTKSWLNFPTFKYKDEEGEWFIRCSWMGLFEIHLRKVLYKNDNYNFIRVIDKILEYRTRYTDEKIRGKTIDEKNIWYKVFVLIKLFCSKTTGIEYDGFKFNEKVKVNDYISFTQRQRYSIILAKKVYCNECQNRIPAECLSKNSLLPSLLYSSLVTDIGSGQKLPINEQDVNIPKLNINEIKNLSTWNNEICAFGSERGFIYYDPHIKIREREDTYNYDTYWKYILRGVQNTVSVRATLQSLQTQIKKINSKLPDLIAAMDDQPTSQYKFDENLTCSLANIIQTMPQINNVCIPTVAFKANYAVVKFQYLNDQCFGFNELLAAVRRDIKDVSAFLQFYKQYQLQIGQKRRLEIDSKKNQLASEQLQGELKEESKRTVLHIIVAIAAFVALFPTVVEDGAKLLTEYSEPKEEHFIIYIYICIFFYIVIATIICLTIYFYFEFNEDKPLHISPEFYD